MSDELAPYVIIQSLDGSKCIGAGAYGVVREVRVNGLPCIAKRLHDILTNEQSVGQEQRRAISERFRNECILLSRLRHPNIVQFLGVHYGKDRYDLTLVMERMHMDLETALEKYPNMPLPIKIRILLDASYGLLHLHCQTPPIVHRDFTAANILLSPDMRAKVADLGVSKILDMSPQQFSKHTKCPGALGYMPPEAIQQKPVYDVKLDVFSFGHLALYTVNQRFPEVHELGPEGAKAHKNGTAQLVKRTVAIDMMGKDHCLHQLVTSCLKDSPEKRPTTSEVNSTLMDLLTQHPMKGPTGLCDELQEMEKRKRKETALMEKVEKLYIENSKLQKQWSTLNECLEKNVETRDERIRSLESEKAKLQQEIDKIKMKGLYDELQEKEKRERETTLMKKVEELYVENSKLQKQNRKWSTLNEYLDKNAKTHDERIRSLEREKAELQHKLDVIRMKDFSQSWNDGEAESKKEADAQSRNLGAKWRLRLRTTSLSSSSLLTGQRISSPSPDVLEEKLRKLKEELHLCQAENHELRGSLRELQLEFSAVEQSIRQNKVQQQPTGAQYSE